MRVCEYDGLVRSKLPLATVVLASNLVLGFDASAASVLVVAHSDAAATAADLQANTSHTFASWNSSVAVPTLLDLQPYDVVLLYGWAEPNGPAVGNAVASYFEAGGGVVHGSFYIQQRNATGWGMLENHDVFTGTAGGCEYLPDTMDAASVVGHPITAGVASLSAQSYRGGASSKLDATVLATWTGTNDLGEPDPVVALRQVGQSCIVGIGVFPGYSAYGVYGIDYAGDFYTLFDNAISWAAGCSDSCGDMVVDPFEDCDDGNLDETDDCLSTCEAASCGDGFVWVGNEECDDGNLVDSDDCPSSCEPPYCGDGFPWAGMEQCDDGNLVDTDACLSTCELPACGDGFTWVGNEECDDGNLDDTDGCLATCELAACGDGLTWVGLEDCDDGNSDDDDACIECVAATCGDGYVWVGEEECDDGNLDSDDACPETCVPASCGDGYVWAGEEECDDGNSDDTDACTNACESNDPGTSTGTDASTGADTGADTTAGTGGDSGLATDPEVSTGPTIGDTTGDVTTSGTSGMADGGATPSDGCACSSRRSAPGGLGPWGLGLVGLMGLWGRRRSATRRR